MSSRADTHDLDKLKRWHKDLEATPDDAPPVFAIFLVSEVDQVAHDAFRAFRSSFEDSRLGFGHLVIFGQHGVSATARQLREKFGLEADGVPRVVLLSGDDAQPEVVELPQGGSDKSSEEAGQGWRLALARAERTLGGEVKEGRASLATLREICAELSGLDP